MSKRLPVGIKWSRNGDSITGTVTVVEADGTHRDIATVEYTREQAARVASQLLGVMGGA